MSNVDRMELWWAACMLLIGVAGAFKLLVG